MYHCVAITPEGFIQQLAVCYVGRGYLFYVIGEVPEHKNLADVDITISASDQRSFLGRDMSMRMPESVRRHFRPPNRSSLVV